jgi:outer membrane protein assembly factor BamB
VKDNRGGPAKWLAAAIVLAVGSSGLAQEVRGWLNWRGPTQNGASTETGLPDKWVPDGGANDLWSIKFSGRGTPVIATMNGKTRVYSWGYRGEGPNLQEVLACLDAETGKTIWEKAFNDFLSDVVYDRYSIGSPVVDPATGNVFLCTTPGDIHAFTPEGKELWHVSTMESYGRLTFPNGRTGAPVIDRDNVIIHQVTGNWGGEGPVRDRFYAFDKKNGNLVWSSDPGVGPPFLKDNSFATPVLTHDKNGNAVFYCATGDGNVVCVNSNNGKPIWRHQICMGGLNSSPVLYKDTIIAIHALENVDSSKTGGMFCIKLDAPIAKPAPPPATPAPAPTVPPAPGAAPVPAPPLAAPGTPTLEKGAEVWRNDLIMFSSSSVIAGDHLYQVDNNGVLWSVNPATGAIEWSKKLGSNQVHASPLFADGKLYVPMNEGDFFILKPGEKDAEELAHVKLEGKCLGSPAVWGGKVYVHTTAKLYCFGAKGEPKNLPPLPVAEAAKPAGKPVALRIEPAEVLLRPGAKATFEISEVDAAGAFVKKTDKVAWASYIPPTAKVKALLDAKFNDQGELVAADEAAQSAGAFQATEGELKGTIRGRILPKPPYHEDFEKYELKEDQVAEKVKFAYPPLPWIGARFKWEVRDVGGSKVLAKTVDNILMMRAMSFIGHPDAANYTLTADVMTEGNRRVAGEVGLVNQRYMFTLDGAAGKLRVTSNHERITVEKDLDIKPTVWYSMKTRVDVKEDGSGVAHVKVWKRGEAEPAEWTLDVPHDHAHLQGAPGLFGFSPQPKCRVYIDNVDIKPNN